MKKIYFILSFLLIMCKSDFASTVLVTVNDFKFDPANITVNVGDTIIWIYSSGVHTTTSTLIPDDAVAWNSPLNQSNPMFMYVFATTGSYDYECNYNASRGMTGHISVQDPATVPTLASSGSGVSYKFSAEKLAFSFAEAGSWRIGVYDVSGSLAKSVGYVSSGKSFIEFSVDDLPQGIYTVKMTNGINEFTGKLIRDRSN